MVRFAKALPRLRRRVERDLGDCVALDRRCVLAAAVRLLERGFFRIGSEEYAAENESYGLATMRKEHVTRRGRRRDGLRLPGQERPASAPGRARRRSCARSSPRSSGAAAAGPSCWPTRSAGAGTTCARTTSTSTSRRPPAATSRPRTSAPGTRPRWRPWRSPCRARRRRRRRRASARSSARSRRWPATSATRRRSAAPPTSIRACSTRSTAGLTIRPALERVAARLEPGDLPIHQPALEAAVLDLIDERVESPAVEQLAA